MAPAFTLWNAITKWTCSTIFTVVTPTKHCNNEADDLSLHLFSFKFIIYVSIYLHDMFLFSSSHKMVCLGHCSSALPEASFHHNQICRDIGVQWRFLYCHFLLCCFLKQCCFPDQCCFLKQCCFLQYCFLQCRFLQCRFLQCCFPQCCFLEREYPLPVATTGG